MWTYNTTPELYHHGIKGMKWGVRRYQNKDGSLTPAGKRRNKQYVQDLGDGVAAVWPSKKAYKKAERARIKNEKAAAERGHDDHQKAMPKKARDMSDKELRESINRLQMEKQYAQLTAKEKSYGRKLVENLLTESGKEIAKSYITKYGKMGIEAGVKYLADSAKKKSA